MEKVYIPRKVYDIGLEAGNDMSMYEPVDPLPMDYVPRPLTAQQILDGGNRHARRAILSKMRRK